MTTQQRPSHREGAVIYAVGTGMIAYTRSFTVSISVSIFF